MTTTMKLADVRGLDIGLFEGSNYQEEKKPIMKGTEQSCYNANFQMNRVQVLEGEAFEGIEMDTFSETLETAISVAQTFEEVVAARKNEQNDFKSNSFFQKNKEKFACSVDGCGFSASALGGLSLVVPNAPICLALRGAALTMRGISNFSLNCAKFQDMIKFGLQKYNRVEIFYASLGVVNSILLMLAGLFLISGSLIVQFSRYSNGIFMNAFTWCFNLFGFGLTGVIAMFQILLESFRAYRSIKFRKELNRFLEDKHLTDEQKYLGYLKTIKEKITLTPAEEAKIEKKVIDDYIKNRRSDAILIDKDHPEVKLAIEEAKNRKIKEKIEEFQKLTSGDITDKLLALPTEEEHLNTILIDRLIITLTLGPKAENKSLVHDALKVARGLVEEIDKASYQNLWSHYLYITIAVLCLTASIIGLLAGLSIITLNPWVLVVVWAFIAVSYLVLDYSKTNKLITGFIYDHGINSITDDQGFHLRSRKEKASEMIPQKHRRHNPERCLLRQMQLEGYCVAANMGANQYMELNDNFSPPPIGTNHMPSSD